MILSPFLLLHQNHIDRMEKLGYTFLVAQEYDRGINRLKNDDDLIDILLTDYNDLGLAENHEKAVKHQQYGCIINLKNVVHYQRLQDMLQENKYRLYWSTTLDKKKTRKMVRDYYRPHIDRYLREKTKWNVGGDRLKIEVEVTFGEVYVYLRWRGQEERPLLADLEKYDSHH